jgi:hypothetical protein
MNNGLVDRCPWLQLASNGRSEHLLIIAVSSLYVQTKSHGARTRPRRRILRLQSLVAAAAHRRAGDGYETMSGERLQPLPVTVDGRHPVASFATSMSSMPVFQASSPRSVDDTLRIRRCSPVHIQRILPYIRRIV